MLESAGTDSGNDYFKSVAASSETIRHSQMPMPSVVVNDIWKDEVNQLQT